VLFGGLVGERIGVAEPQRHRRALDAALSLDADELLVLIGNFNPDLRRKLSEFWRSQVSYFSRETTARWSRMQPLPVASVQPAN
jgi:hypothetical protein